MATRYAIYVVPRAGTPLGRFGARWLADETLGLEPALHDGITAKPRRYGFHATLKAPFRLAEGRSPEGLRDALARFAAARPAPRPLPLKLHSLGGFLALVPAADGSDIAALAQACVETFDPFRAPLTEAELARRRAGGLTPRQDDYLLRWGYPYVAEEYRFHMTLTDRLDDALRATVQSVLQPALAPLLRTALQVEALALLRQESPDARFALIEQFPLAAPTS